MLTLLLLAGVVLQQDEISYPQVLWHVEGPLGAPLVTEDAVYSGGFGLFRIDRETGEVLRVVESPEEVDEERRPTFAKGPVIHGELLIARRYDGSVVAYDLSLEEKRWEWADGAYFGPPGTLVDGAYVLASGSAVYSLDASTGEPRWKRVLPNGVVMTPASDDQHVYVGTRAGSFHALARDTGEPVWTQEGHGPFGWTDPVVADGHVYVGDRGLGGSIQRGEFGRDVRELESPRGGALFAFEASSGRLLWGRSFGATGLSRPFVWKKEILAGFGRFVGRFDRETGAIEASRSIRTGTNPFGSPTVVGERLYFGNLDGHLYVHDLASGKLLWAFQVPGQQVHDFVHTGDRVFVSTLAGLFALGPGEKGGGGSVLVWQGD
jgi:outer membrane protein assembly factor BamB